MPNTMNESAVKPKTNSRKILVTLAIIGSAVCVLAGAGLTYLFVGRALLAPKATVYFEPEIANTAVTISPIDLESAARVLSNRFQAIGYGSPWTSFEATGDGRIKAQIPTSIDAEIIEGLKAAGLVEFVDFGKTPLANGTSVKTDYPDVTQLDSGVYHTILTGASIKDSFVSVDQSGRYEIEISLEEEWHKNTG
ncbi:MAG: hypothetical protein AB9891_01115 [Anaerolineaceae bacterium]